MKKLLATALFFALSVSAVNAAFVDVPANHIYDDAIDYVEDREIVHGFSDGTFRPDSLITRGQFTKIIIGSLYSLNDIEDCDEDYDLGFDLYRDVDMNDTFADYICMASAKNIVDGYSDDYFRPNEYITLGQASKILAEAYNLSGSRRELRDYAEELIDENYIPVQLRALNEYVTRGQMAEMVYRIKEDISNRPDLEDRDLYDRIISLEYVDHSTSRDELEGYVLDRLNYSVFKNNFNEFLKLDYDERSADDLIDDLENLDNDESAKILVYMKDGEIVYGYVYEID